MVVDKFGREVQTTKRRYLFTSPYHDLQNKRLARPEGDDDVVTKNYLDSLLESFTTKDELEILKQDLNKIQYFFDIDNKRIVRLSEPTAGFHAVTKTYVDNKDKANKLQIRAECEKVKREAVAEGDKKREAIKSQLLNAIDPLRKDVNGLIQTVEALKKSVTVLQANRRIDNLYLNVLYKHLNIDKSLVDTNVGEATNN